jgi:hypothetical protein
MMLCQLHRQMEEKTVGFLCHEQERPAWWKRNSPVHRPIEACLKTADVCIQGYSSNGPGTGATRDG